MKTEIKQTKYNRSQLMNATGFPLTTVIILEEENLISRTPDSSKRRVYYSQETLNKALKLKPLLKYSEIQFAKAVGSDVSSLTRYRERGILKPSISFKRGSYIKRFYSEAKVEEFKNALANTNKSKYIIRQERKKSKQQHRKEMGERLKESREFLGYTLEEVAQNVDLTRSMMSLYEVGKNYPNDKVFNFFEEHGIRREYIEHGKLPKVFTPN